MLASMKSVMYDFAPEAEKVSRAFRVIRGGIYYRDNS